MSQRSTPIATRESLPTRVVTGHDDRRRAILADVGPSPVVTGISPNPEMFLAELWYAGRLGAGALQHGDVTAETPFTLEPPPGGAIFRLVNFPPEGDLDTDATQAQAREVGIELEGGDDYGMHATDTIDFITIISGEMAMEVDEGEVTLRPGDTVVQRGTRHAWRNRGSEPCLLSAVLISAKDGA